MQTFLGVRHAFLPHEPLRTSGYEVVFTHEVTAAMLVSQNKEMAAMLVSQTKPLGIELYFYANAFFCFSKPIWPAVTWMKTLYQVIMLCCFDRVHCGNLNCFRYQERLKKYSGFTISQLAWKPVGRALHRHRRGYGFESRSSLNFFQAFFSQLLKLHSNCEDLSSIWSFIRSSIYISHLFTFIFHSSREYYELTIWSAPSWLDITDLKYDIT